MSPSQSQSLASRRTRRQTKPTARIQQMFDERRDRIQRVGKAKEKAKEKAMSASQVELINDTGDDLMYGPAESYAPPTLTGDSDLDRQRFEAAEAKHVLQLLAHRGDGDWSLHYQEGKVGLPLLQEARDHPGAKLIERAIGKLAITSAKGKGRATTIDDLDQGSAAVESSGQRPTMYSGITIGKSPPESSYQQGATRATPRLLYPSSTPPTSVKRPAAFDEAAPPAKKSRVDSKGPQKPSVQGGPAKRRVALATAPGKPKAPPSKTSYGRPATSLRVVTFGPQDRAPVFPGSQPNKEPNQPKPGKPTPSNHDRHPDPLHSLSPHLARDNGGFAVAPQIPIPPPPAQPARNRPAIKNPWADPIVDDVPQPPPFKHAAKGAPSDKKPYRHQPPPPADAWDRIHAARNETNADVRQPATANKDGVAQARLDKQRADKQRLEKPRLDKPRIDMPQDHTPRTDKPRADKPRADKPRADKPRADKTRAGKAQVDTPQVEHKAPANNRAGKTYTPPLPRKTRPALAHKAQRNRRNQRNRRAPEDEENDRGDEHRGSTTDEDDVHGPNLRSSNRPTVESFEPRERRTVKRMIKMAKPWIIACGTFSWRADDPGDQFPSVDTIVADCFALACREHSRRFMLQTEHIICVKSLVTTYRHDIKEAIMALVDKVIGFVAVNKSFNRKLVRWLLPDAFHEAEPEAKGDRHPFESEFIFMAVARILFGPGKMGIKHADRFNPIPIRFLAFLCAICNHVIYCWRRGSFNQDEHLKSSTQEQAFQEYLALLAEMQQARPLALQEVCASMYDDARAAAELNDVAPKPDRPAREWAPDIDKQYVSKYVAPTAKLGTGHDTNDDEDDGSNGSQLGDNQADDGADDQMDDGDQSYASGWQVEGEDIEDDNHGEGPSKPYGAQTTDTSDDEDSIGQAEPSDEEMDS